MSVALKRGPVWGVDHLEAKRAPVIYGDGRAVAYRFAIDTPGPCRLCRAPIFGPYTIRVSFRPRLDITREHSECTK